VCQVPGELQLYIPIFSLAADTSTLPSADLNQKSNQCHLFSSLHAGNPVVDLQMQTWRWVLACCLRCVSSFPGICSFFTTAHWFQKANGLMLML